MTTRMKVSDVMTKDVRTIASDALLKDAVEVMTVHYVGGLPVLDADGALVGMITEGDVVRAAGRTVREHMRLGRRPAMPEHPGRFVCDHMSTDVLTVRPDDEARVAARLMAKAGVRQLPVVDGDMVVGIVARRDVLEVFARSDQVLEEAVRHFLESCGFVEPEARVKVHVDDGVVGLTGLVEHASDVRILGSLAATVDGVVDVVNHTRYRHEDPSRRSA